MEQTFRPWTPCEEQEDDRKFKVLVTEENATDFRW